MLNRITEHTTAQVKRDLKRSSEPNCCRKGSLDGIIQHPAQLCLEQLQLMGVPPFSYGDHSSDCSQCKRCLSYIKMKPFLVQIAPVALCPLHAAPCEERASIHFVASL